MTTQMGVWIDHRKAIVVAVTDQTEQLSVVISKAEKQLRRSGDSPLQGSYESQQVPADDSRQRALTGHLNIYYDAVVASLKAADSILIFGPGEAKGELKERLEKHKLSARITAIEKADRMTDHQIAAKVCQYFANKPARHGVGRDSHPRSNKSNHDRNMPRSVPASIESSLHGND